MAASSSMNSGTVGSRRWDLNPRPAVYETAALPLSYAGEASCAKVLRGGRARRATRLSILRRRRHRQAIAVGEGNLI
jgi:hypothetical protein